MNTLVKRTLSVGAAAVLATAGIATAASPAHASIANECIVSYYSPGTYRAWCGAAAPGTYFRLVLTCKNSSEAYYYASYGPWRTQGGHYWSYAPSPAAVRVSWAFANDPVRNV